MNMYEWEPVEDTVYPESIMATRTAGMFFDILHVEYDNDGWHAMFLNFGDDDTEMVDDTLHLEEVKAQAWAEATDILHMSNKVEAGEASEEEEAWLAMAGDGDVA